MSIERQMQELQKTQNQFQTTDQKKNTEMIMEELEKEKKENLKLNYLNEIDNSKLNNEERDFFNVAVNFQLENSTPIRIDLEKNLIVTEENEIMKVENRDGNFTIINENNEEKNILKNEETIAPMTYQKKLMPSSNTIYSTNN